LGPRKALLSREAMPLGFFAYAGVDDADVRTWKVLQL
jgi:hypothetical protein